LQYDPKSKLMFCDICVSAQVGSWLSKLAPENGTWWFFWLLLFGSQCSPWIS
jgi:hypothetical protein